MISVSADSWNYLYVYKVQKAGNFIFTYILSEEYCLILLPLDIIYMLDRRTSTCKQCKILK